jgi:hypothetical protein
MANRALIPVLVTMMLVTGVCNTILNKYQVCLAICFFPQSISLLIHRKDMQCVRNCNSPDPKERMLFEQPVVQTYVSVASAFVVLI